MVRLGLANCYLLGCQVGGLDSTICFSYEHVFLLEGFFVGLQSHKSMRIFCFDSKRVVDNIEPPKLETLTLTKKHGIHSTPKNLRRCDVARKLNVNLEVSFYFS